MLLMQTAHGAQGSARKLSTHLGGRHLPRALPAFHSSEAGSRLQKPRAFPGHTPASSHGSSLRWEWYACSWWKEFPCFERGSPKVVPQSGGGRREQDSWPSPGWWGCENLKHETQGGYLTNDQGLCINLLKLEKVLMINGKRRAQERNGGEHKVKSRMREQSQQVV